MPTCAECQHGTITPHSSGDRCASEQNTQAFPPYALRHDEALCGSIAAWFEKKGDPGAEYKADVAMGRVAVARAEIK